VQRLTDEQRDLVEKHIGIAVNVAKKYGSGMGFGDAAQEAVIGIIDAAFKFDPSRDLKFSTLAHRRAVGAMLDAKRESVGIVKLKRHGQRKGMEAPRVWGIDDFLRVLGTESSVVDDAARSEWHSRFYEALRSLSPREQAIIRGRISGEPSTKIAKKLGLSAKSVDCYAPQAYANLAEAMCQQGKLGATG
jgi:RNA polymerase sigma factor (sigma-70 family)